MNFHAPGTALRRRAEIRKLVAATPVRSQDELASLLAARGFLVAQPTLSRDVRELGLAKSPRGYVLPAAAGPSDPGVEAKGFEPIGGDRTLAGAASADARLDRAIRENVLEVLLAGTLVVVKTPPAGANPVALAIDGASLAEVVGTIAGDDTAFVATRTPVHASRLAERLRQPLAKDTPSRVRPSRSPRRGRA